MMALWHDRRGRFSSLRAATLLLLVAPFFALVYFALTHELGARPRTEAIHEMGLWGIRFLMLSLFVTPMRRIARYAQLVDVRRMIGVAVFCYMALHFALYIYDEVFDMAKVVSEIVLRYYLTIGFTAWVGLGVLAATSNNAMVRELGGIRWRNLHRLVYPITVLGAIHYFMQSKLEVFEPTVIGGIFIWLMVYRVLHWQFPRQTEFPLWVIAISWFAVGAFTFLAEAVAFKIAFDAPILRVLEMDFNFRAGIRPGWYVWGVGVLVVLIGVIRLKPLSGWLSFATGSASRTTG
jgi:methionine sulfoxide reductase heme-binding subunit